MGFTSAAAIIIATSQVKDILGLKLSGDKFLEVWQQIFQHIGETRLWDALLGFTCMAVLFVLRVSEKLFEFAAASGLALNKQNSRSLLL